MLHYAVLSGNIEIVNLIIKQGAKLNYEEGFDLGKPSALDLAILKGDPEIIQLLITSGTVALEIRLSVFYTKFIILGANVNCSSPIIGSPLHVACADNIPNRYEIIQV